MNADYFVLSLRNLSHLAEAWVSGEAFARGALGISEALPFTQPEGEEDVFTRLPDRRAVDVYFQAAPSGEFIQDLNARFPDAEYSVKGEAAKDWLAEWKKGFKPFALAGGHWVIPSWCEPPQEALHRIWIDPGMAFGTGTHETTQLMAETMLKIFSDGKLNSCLDVGTGTGILAILARQLGVKKVRATEIEAEGRRVACENFRANDCDSIALDEKQVEDLNETYDLVAANIIDGVLLRLQDTLKARVKKGGWLVVSGIIGEREQDFLAGFKLPAGATWLSREVKGDWRLFATRL